MASTGEPDRIRKQADELTRSDWQRFPAWEYCLDEEDEEGQDETTLRPCATAIDFIDFYGLIAVEFRFADSRIFAGYIEASGQANPQTCSHVLCLPSPAQSFVSVPLPRDYNAVITADTSTLAFELPNARHLPDARARELFQLVYAVLDTRAESTWPMTITPRVEVQGWPASWTREGWRRLSDGSYLR